MPTSSRILFHLSRLMAAVPAFRPRIWFVGGHGGQRLVAVGRVGRWSAPRRRLLPSLCAGAREETRSGLCRPPPGYVFTFPG